MTPELQTWLDKIDVEWTYLPHSLDGVTNQEILKLMLKWKAKVSVDGRGSVEVSYFCGLGHFPIPSLREGIMTRKLTADQWRRLEEYLSGRRSIRMSQSADRWTPDKSDLLYCLCSEADILDYSGFPEWADCLGYDSDSIKARETYDACMRQTLSLRQLIDIDEGRRLFSDAEY